MADYRTLDDLGDIRGQRALVRVDYNLPLQDGRVTDTTRVERTLPTIEALRQKGAKIVLLAHMGRPKGKANPDYSLRHIVDAVQGLLGKIAFAEDCVGDKARQAIDGLNDGEIALLENVRFHAGEERNDPDFAKALSANGDLYINDAFSCAHRAHASTEGLAHCLKAYAGRTMEAELNALGQALEKPARPVIAFVGGAKISTKLDLLNNLSEKVDTIVIGGGMANTFLNAIGKPVGNSLCESELADTAKQILKTARLVDCQIVLPTDVVVAAEFKAGSPSRTVNIDDVEPDDMILDLGPESLADIGERLESARTVVWNGPLGAFEIEPFDTGTNMAANMVAKLTREGKLISVAGGGDTVAALNHAGAAGEFTYVSTAGGAFLEWLEGKELPGVTALKSE